MVIQFSHTRSRTLTHTHTVARKKIEWHYYADQRAFVYPLMKKFIFFIIIYILKRKQKKKASTCNFRLFVNYVNLMKIKFKWTEEKKITQNSNELCVYEWWPKTNGSIDVKKRKEINLCMCVSFVGCNRKNFKFFFFLSKLKTICRQESTFIICLVWLAALPLSTILRYIHIYLCLSLWLLKHLHLIPLRMKMKIIWIYKTCSVAVPAR